MKIYSLIVTVLLIACIAWALNERTNKKITEQAVTKTGQAERIANPEAEKVKDFIDSLKQNHTTFKTPNSVDGKLVAISKSVIDTIAKLSGVEKPQVVNWQRVAMQVRDSLLIAKKENNNLKQDVLYFRDKWLEVSYTPPIAGDTTSHGSFNLKYNAELNITQYKKGGKFLGLQLFQPSYYTDIYANDPRLKIKGYKSITIDQNKPAFGLKVDAVGKYDLQTGYFRFGAGARFDIGRTMLTFDNYYSPDGKTFYQEAGARFSIFK